MSFISNRHSPSLMYVFVMKNLNNTKASSQSEEGDTINIDSDDEQSMDFEVSKNYKEEKLTQKTKQQSSYQESQSFFHYKDTTKQMLSDDDVGSPEVDSPLATRDHNNQHEDEEDHSDEESEVLIYMLSCYISTNKFFFFF